MSMYADDWEYANSRLAETIVRRDGQPVYIHNVGKDMRVKYSSLDDFDDYAVCTVDDLDLKPVPLGYCNFNKQASYLSRVPMRRDWRQGLRKGNFTSTSGYPAEMIPYPALKKAILGEFPDFKAALEAVKKITSIAWHRHWALNKYGAVFYKGDAMPVGKIVDGKPVLESRFTYLQQALDEAL